MNTTRLIRQELDAIKSVVNRRELEFVQKIMDGDHELTVFVTSHMTEGRKLLGERAYICGYVLLTEKQYRELGRGYDSCLFASDTSMVECTYDEKKNGYHVIGWDYDHVYNEDWPLELCIEESLVVAITMMTDLKFGTRRGI